jgi:CrcB protein
VHDGTRAPGHDGAVVRAALIGLAGAAGAMARYWIGQAVGVRSFPWATLSINVAGSFLLGLVLAGPGFHRWSENATAAVTVGFLGAFTTYSTFTNETTALLRDERALAATTYVLVSLAAGLTAAALGYALGRATR